MKVKKTNRTAKSSGGIKAHLPLVLIISALAAAVLCLPLSRVFSSTAGGVDKVETVVFEKLVSEDAYIRNGSNADKNYNFENITKAHGAAYENAGYTVINAKNYSGGEIIGVMKFPLPAKSELEAGGVEALLLNFSVFKNADYKNGDQSYDFYICGDTDWSEGTLTWNNSPSAITGAAGTPAATLSVSAGTEYEKLDDSEKLVKLDITDALEPYIESGASSVTIFVRARTNLLTSILIHSKETSVSDKRARITGVKKISVDSDPKGNIALGKPARSNLSRDEAFKVTDGNSSTYWSGDFFPSYVDVDLGSVYRLESVSLSFPASKKQCFTLYGSKDGAKYDELAKVRQTVNGSDGEYKISFDKAEEYRILRVYLEYTVGDSRAYLSELRAFGQPTWQGEGALRTGSFFEISGIEDFESTPYALPITEDETIDNIYGIVERTIGQDCREWFLFDITEDAGDDFFTLEDKGGKILISGNKGVTVTAGLNYYYKNYLKVCITEQANQVKVPENPVRVGAKVRKQTDSEVRYAFNYCTLCYTFAFADTEDWQRENDWLALNGVNVVLDLAGQEATWMIFLMEHGYSFDDAKDWLSGPAYLAWQMMDNLEAFGGPLPDGYIADRVELARATGRWKRSLGIETVLQGYAGMVPVNFGDYCPEAELIVQGSWNGFERPSMIATDSKMYEQLAADFYEAQEYVYGKNGSYYAVDPFHEGGKRPAGLSDAEVSAGVLKALTAYDGDAVWLIQGWQSNPTAGLISGMGALKQTNVLIIDLIKYPIKDWTKYNRTKYGSTVLPAVEFDGTDWVFGLLSGFGGNPTMNGQLQTMVDSIMSAKKTSAHMKGIGIISEAQFDNPVVSDLLFDLVWADDSFKLDDWLDGYIERRYGQLTENARLAWQIMKNSNYSSGTRFTPEVYGMKNKTPQGYSLQSIDYGAASLESALKLLYKDFELLKGSEGYLYDIRDIARQVVSNYSTLIYDDILTAVGSKDLKSFQALRAKFEASLVMLNTVLSTGEGTLAGEWIGKAADMGAKYDDFSVNAFTMNAKALITSWGSRSAHANLKDYGWRNYEGMFTDLYAAIWKDYLGELEKGLSGGTTVTKSVSEYFDVYWKWNLNTPEYTRVADSSPESVFTVVGNVLDGFLVGGRTNPDAGNVAFGRLVSSDFAAGSLSKVTDGANDSFAVLNKNGTAAPFLTVDLIAHFELTRITVNARDGEAFVIYTSDDKIVWEKLDTGSGYAEFTLTRRARYIKLEAAGSTLTVFELRAYGTRAFADADMLAELIKYAKDSGDGNAAVNAALIPAEKSCNASAAVDELEAVYGSLYDALLTVDLYKRVNLAEGKGTTAHNDPSGSSKNLTDTDSSSCWDSGRLSPPGVPYQEDISEGWVIVDLGRVYTIDEIRLTFGSSSLWYKYRICVSEKKLAYGDNGWITFAVKDNENTPSDAEDDHKTSPVAARYIMLVTTDIKTEASGKRSGYRVSGIYVYEYTAAPEKKADTAELEELVSKCSALSDAGYTAESFNALKDALNAARALLASESATEKEISDALLALTAARDALVPGDGASDDPLPPEEPEEKKPESSILPFILVGALAVIAAAGGALTLLYRRRRKK